MNRLKKRLRVQLRLLLLAWLSVLGIASAWGQTGTISTLPWTEGFESYDVGSESSPAPTGWEMINFNQGTYPYVFIASSSSLRLYVHSGSKSLFFESGANKTGIIVFPKFSVDLSNTELSFWYKNDATSEKAGTLSVGYITDVSNASSFVNINSLAKDNYWRQGVLTIPTLPTNARLAFRYSGGTSDDYWVGLDDIVIYRYTPPTNLRVEDVSSDGATIKWDAVDGISSYNVVVKQGGTVLASGTANTNSFQLTGLSSATEYKLDIEVTNKSGETVVSRTATKYCKFTTEQNYPYDSPTLLSVGDITTNSATLTWSAVTGASSYDVVVKQGNNVLSSGNVTTNSYQLTGLQPETKYDLTFQVTAKGSEGESSPATLSYEFTTQETIIATLPWTEDFETFNTGSITTNAPSSNWKLLNLDDPMDYPYAEITSSETAYAKSGKCLYLTSSRDRSIVVILPPATVNLNNAEISFWYRHKNTDSYAGTLTVGYITDVTDETTFTALKDMDRVDVMTKGVHKLTNIPSGARVAFRYTAAGSRYYLGLDDITISPIVSYSTPVNITLEDITHNSATLKWDAVEGASSYDVVVKQGENVLSSGNVTTNSYTFAVEQNTAYSLTFEVVAKGEKGISPKGTNDINFRTHTGTVSALPWTEGFESFTSTTPYNWTLINSNNGSYPYIFVSDYVNYHKSGSRALVFTSGTNKNAIAVLPPITANLSQSEIIFWYRSTLTDEKRGKVSMGYITNVEDESTYVPLQTIALNRSDNYYQVIQSLASVPAGARLAFCYHGERNNLRICLDDITIQQVACNPVTNIQIKDITHNSATVKWNAVDGATSYDVVVKQGDDILSQGTVTTTNYSLTDLQALTTYSLSITVTANNAEGAARPATAGISILTNAVPVGLPWSEDFESYAQSAIPTGWATINNVNHHLYVDEWGVHSGEKSLIFRSIGGINPIAILPPFSVQSWTNAEIYFWYRTTLDSNQNGTLSVGYITDVTDETTYHPIKTVDNTKDITECKVSLTDVPVGARLAFCNAGNTTYLIDAVIDDIAIYPYSAPKNIHIDDITATTATLKWDAVEGASSYDVTVLDGETTLWSGNVTTASHKLTGLQLQTSYNYTIQVTARGEQGTSNRTEKDLSFCTTIESATSLLWYEGFESYGYNPIDGKGGWATLNCSQSSEPNIYTEPGHGLESSNGLIIIPSPYKKAIAILPEISAELMNNTDFSFWYRSQSEYDDYPFSVGYITDVNDETTYQSLKTIDRETDATEVVLPLTNIPTGARLAFSYQGSSSVTLVIDEISIQQQAQYASPANIRVENIRAHGATAKWDAVAGATSYDVVVRKNNTVLASGNVTDLSYAFDGLEAAAQHTVYIQVTAKGAQGTSRHTAKYVKLKTPLALPWSEDFTNITNFGTQSDGWLTPGYNTGYYHYACVGRDEHDNSCLEIQTNKVQTPGLVILPEIDAELSQAELTFRQYGQMRLGESTIKIGYVTDINDINSFCSLKEVKSTLLYSDVLLSLASLPKGARVAIAHEKHTTSYSTVYLDNFTICERGAYERPADVSVANTTKTGATLTWDAIEGATSYDVVVKQGDAVLSSGNVTTNSYTLSNLQPAMPYTIVVQVIAKGTKGESNQTNKSVQFNTLTDPVATLPWHEGFEGMDNGNYLSLPPVGWDYLNCNKGWYPVIRVKDTKVYTKSGTKYLSFLGYKKSYAILPEFSADLKDAEISFWYENENTNERNCTLSFGYITDIKDETTYHPLLTTEKSAIFNIATQSLAEVPAGARLAFCCQGNHAIVPYELSIDDITIKHCGPYNRPVNLSVEDITTTAATLKWDAVEGATSYDVVVKHGDTVLSSGTATTNSYTISGLVPTSCYRCFVEVTAKGSKGSSLPTQEYIKFKTKIGTINSLPWTDDFEYYAIGDAPYGWTLVKGEEIVIIENYSISGAQSLSLQVNTIDKDQILLLPEVSSDLMSNAELCFGYKTNIPMSAEDYFTFSVGYLTDISSPSTFKFTNYITSKSDNGEITLPLDGIPAGYRIALRAVPSIAGYVFIDDVTIRSLTPSVNVNTAHYATYSSKKDAVITTQGVKAYKASVTGNIVTITELQGYIPAGTGVLLIGENDGIVEFAQPAEGATPADVTGNDLKATTLVDGSLAAKPTDGYTYALGPENLFMHYTSSSFVHNRAYLWFDEDPCPEASNDDAKTMTIVFADDVATGIYQMENGKWTMDNEPNAMYNLHGVRVSNSYKGIVIKNGSKYINK